MRADPLRRKVLRDVLQLRGQMLAIVVVMASGVALFVTLRGMHDYLRDAQQAYYTQYRFADVFVRARRLPLSAATSVAAVPGVSWAAAITCSTSAASSPPRMIQSGPLAPWRRWA